LVKPATVHGDAVQVPVRPPGKEIAVYAVIVAPPLEESERLTGVKY
jgi:hypothetical protein